ncbi:MAG TPA: maltose alpha-D-glucosyltransferase [Candidatus Binataceae bacterium]|nr:maltose alpha-D-glucosyltransferase [Candidatus Binataceae bacterium]
MKSPKDNYAPSTPLWYKDAIFYELRVRSFYDSNGDGVGDFPGLTAKLPYLQSLGVTAVWLLPFYPSPLRDDGYDISHYTEIHPDLGTLNDFKVFLREAHSRGLHVVTELVVNHTSNQHEWFQRARRAAAGSNHRDYYVWSDTPERYKDARVIFQDFEPSNWAFDPVAKAYYFHRFYSHQPDLNYDNPAVRREVMRVMDFWLGLGVDGMRLDAVPYLYKRDGTNCENLPETHAFLRDLRRHVDENFSNRMLLAEANQWPEDAVSYLGEGKECHMAFHFPLMPRMFMAVRMEDRFPITDIWAQTPPIDETCQWALFLRNHDELTLEMVSDEERDYMYRAFAREPRTLLNLGIRRRLAPLLGNNRRTIELNNGLLFSLPGTPVIYYGDELGMGDYLSLGDRDGVRTPMQWSADRNAGFSTASPQRLVLPVVIDYEYHYQTVNVEAQDANLHSLLWWMRRLIALRRQFKAFGRGSIEFLSPENPRVLAFIRSYEDERILVVANLSRFVQYADLDLSKFKSMVPVELFGRNPFPAIGEQPYHFTLGPHLFLWFSIEPEHRGSLGEIAGYGVPQIEISTGFENLMRTPLRHKINHLLPDYLPHCRWFRAKTRSIRAAYITEALPLTENSTPTYLALINVDYRNAESETYVLPMALATGEAAAQVRSRWPDRIIAQLRFAGRNGSGEGLLYDAVADPEFGRALLGMIERHRRIKGATGELTAVTCRHYHDLRGPRDEPCEPRVLSAEQSNTSIVYGDRFILKLFRRLDSGLNPDLEMSRFLSERHQFSHVAKLAGSIDFRAPHSENRDLGILLSFVPNQGDAWRFTADELTRYYEVAATASEPPQLEQKTLVQSLDEEPDQMTRHYVGAYLDAARLLGQRIAELHLALLDDGDDANFVPEPFSALYQRSMYQSMRNLLGQVMRMLSARLSMLPDVLRAQAQAIAANQNQIAARFDAFLKRRLSVVRMRTHGDLHLGQVLYTGKDFIIIDFEGEPARALSERRRKRAALRDVAGMIRSFHYAAYTSLIEQLRAGTLGKVDFAVMEPWAKLWYASTSRAFLSAYIETADRPSLVPKDREELAVLLDAQLMEKAVYEVGYELNNRPEWLRLPLYGIAEMLGLAISGSPG